MKLGQFFGIRAEPIFDLEYSMSSHGPNEQETLHLRFANTRPFPGTFEELLEWNGEIPISIPLEEIKKALQPDGYYSYDIAEAIAYATQKQIKDFFKDYNPDFTSFFSKAYAQGTIGARGSLDKALKAKATTILLKLEILRSPSWYHVDRYFNVDAMTLDDEMQVSLFASDITTDDEKLFPLGRGQNIYENYLIALTTSHIVLILKKSLIFLDEKNTGLDADISAAQTEENTAATIQHSSTIKIPASPHAQVSASAGIIVAGTAAGISLDAAIQSGIRYLRPLAEAALSRVSAVGIGTLLYSPSLGNGELYPATALAIPLYKLDPYAVWGLEEKAAQQGTVGLRHRLFEGDKNYSIVSTPANGPVPSEVPVRALTYNAETNSFFSLSHQSTPIALIFPASYPDDNSTKLPLIPMKRPIYPGVSLSPIEVTAETLPATDPVDFRDCIYCFPAETGLPPIYVVFNRPYGGTTQGVHSGRWYDPEKAGGPTLELDWRQASIDERGIELVKIHTSRFGYSVANSVMIDRLKKILRGDLLASDIDKRFYTHEIRELERYRTLGIPDNIHVDDDGVTWNNTHTATLEDFRIKDSIDQFYTEDAQQLDAIEQAK